MRQYQAIHMKFIYLGTLTKLLTYLHTANKYLSIYRFPVKFPYHFPSVPTRKLIYVSVCSYWNAFQVVRFPAPSLPSVHFPSNPFLLSPSSLSFSVSLSLSRCFLISPLSSLLSLYVFPPLYLHHSLSFLILSVRHHSSSPFAHPLALCVTISHFLPPSPSLCSVLCLTMERLSIYLILKF
ncbi:unnamed protein product [Acanthosepion pharaonis]|uniref:Uncharacterized protein n=1 Tax=Acanthosepion pharaonis TaxID=158019 RepID=A0A812EX25_ACAPH|nr:unnamed protein product [Sepia pharaonis]